MENPQWWEKPRQLTSCKIHYMRGIQKQRKNTERSEIFVGGQPSGSPRGSTFQHIYISFRPSCLSVWVSVSTHDFLSFTTVLFLPMVSVPTWSADSFPSLPWFLGSRPTWSCLIYTHSRRFPRQRVWLFVRIVKGYLDCGDCGDIRRWLQPTRMYWATEYVTQHRLHFDTERKHRDIGTIDYYITNSSYKKTTINSYKLSMPFFIGSWTITLRAWTPLLFLSWLS